MTPWLYLVALATLTLFGRIVAVLLTPHDDEPQPEPAPKHACQARSFGRVCGLTGYYYDRHADGTDMWTCPGCHDLGVAHGYLNNKDVTPL